MIQYVYNGIFNLFLAADTGAKASFVGHFNIFVFHVSLLTLLDLSVNLGTFERS